MENRELGMVEFTKRLKTLYNVSGLNLKRVMRLPDRHVDEKDMPCILVMEGEDIITKRVTREYIGYPCDREFDVIVECWDFTTGTGDVRNIASEVRRAALHKEGFKKGVLLTGVLIRELKTFGPFNFDIPKVLGMRLVFKMSYKDTGPEF